MGAGASAKYEDDPNVSNEEILYRRVRREQWHWAEGRPQSGAFDDSPDGSPMSVALHSLMVGAGMKPEDLLSGHPEFGLVKFTAELVRSLSLAVTAKPPIAGEPAHGLVAGKKTLARKRRLAKDCQVEVQPPPPESPS